MAPQHQHTRRCYECGKETLTYDSENKEWICTNCGETISGQLPSE